MVDYLETQQFNIGVNGVVRSTVLHKEEQKAISTTSLVDHLVLNGGLIDDLGLFYGQMGVILSLFEYGKEHRDFIATRSAEEMLYGLFEQITPNLSYGLASGYAGIAWGICYLQWASFIDVDLPDILDEVDIKVKEINIKRVDNVGLEDGLEGLLHYVLIRSLLTPSFLHTDSDYMSAWDQRIAQKNKLSKLESCYLQWYKLGRIEYVPKDHLLSWIDTTQQNQTDIYNLPLGLRSGIAGKLLKKN